MGQDGQSVRLCIFFQDGGICGQYNDQKTQACKNLFQNRTPLSLKQSFRLRNRCRQYTTHAVILQRPDGQGNGAGRMASACGRSLLFQGRINRRASFPRHLM